MNKKARTMPGRLLLALAFLICAGCMIGANGGGGSGTGITNAPVTGFGSLYVNGIKLDTSGATVSIDGEPADASDLRAGMIATAKGPIETSSTEASAYSIDVTFNIKSAITALDVDNGRLAIAGQSIRFNRLTVFDNSASGTLRIGDMIAVSGLPDISGTLVASYIRRLAPTVDGFMQLTGVISGLIEQQRIFQVGAIAIDYSAANFLAIDAEALSDALRVRITGEVNDNGVLVANTIQELAPAFPVEEGDTLIVEGFVHEQVSNGRFSIGEIAVLTTPVTEYVNGTAADILPNNRIRVFGHLDPSGDVRAEKLEFFLATDAGITGIVESLDPDAKRVSISGFDVTVNNSTLLLDASTTSLRQFSANDIGVGDLLEINGLASGSGIDAVSLKRTGLAGDFGAGAPPPSTAVTFQGLAMDTLADPFFTLGGVTVDTSVVSNADGFLDTTQSPISEQEFFSSLQNDSFVEVGGILNGELLTATRAVLSGRSNVTVTGPDGLPVAGANDLVADWDGTLNTQVDIDNGTTTVNMSITSNTRLLGLPWSVHDIRVFGPGSYSFDTCANTPAAGSCDVVRMTVGANQIGAHMLLDWGSATDLDVVNVWEPDKRFCDDLPNQSCAIFTSDADGNLQPVLNQIVWGLASTDNDGDGGAGVDLMEGAGAGSRAINFNLTLRAATPAWGGVALPLD